MSCTYLVRLVVNVYNFFLVIFSSVWLFLHYLRLHILILASQTMSFFFF
jgi:hypothetical protein